MRLVWVIIGVLVLVLAVTLRKQNHPWEKYPGRYKKAALHHQKRGVYPLDYLFVRTLETKGEEVALQQERRIKRGVLQKQRRLLRLK